MEVQKDVYDRQRLSSKITRSLCDISLDEIRTSCLGYSLFPLCQHRPDTDTISRTDALSCTSRALLLAPRLLPLP